MVTSKICGTCKIDKKLTDFGKCTRAHDGLLYRCKQCNRNGGKISYHKTTKFKRQTDESRSNRNKNYKIWERKQYLTNPLYRIKHNLRRRINHALKGNHKSEKLHSLIGCTTEELKIHLEKSFTIGMNWELYGPYGWHIDHIIPCDKFDLTCPLEQSKCFHYTNLQPLWWYDNLSKSNKI